MKMVVEEHVQRAYGLCKDCPHCTIVGRTEQKMLSSLMPIPVDHPFKILGVDVMELPLTAKGNKYLIVFQDLLQSGLCSRSED